MNDTQSVDDSALQDSQSQDKRQHNLMTSLDNRDLEDVQNVEEIIYREQDNEADVNSYSEDDAADLLLAEEEDDENVNIDLKGIPKQNHSFDVSATAEKKQSLLQELPNDPSSVKKKQRPSKQQSKSTEKAQSKEEHNNTLKESKLPTSNQNNLKDESPQTSQSSSNSQQQQSLQQIEILGAVKVRDGLFLGDEFASQDLEFVIANKVTHIINCAGRQIFNQWTPVGVKYLTFYWLDDDRQLIFDDNDQVAKEIYDFIEEANNDASGVLVHSIRGQSRACCVLSIYLMMKFKWTLLKSLEFINSRRPNLEIRASFLQQLSAWERRTRGTYPRRTDRWDELFHEIESSTTDETKAKEENPTNTKVALGNPGYEELLLRNTFMNAQMQPVNFLQQWKEDVLTSISQSHRQRQKLKWGDNHDENLKHQLVREKSEEDLSLNEGSGKQVPPVNNHKKEFQGKTILKKIIKEIKEEAKINEAKEQSVKQDKQVTDEVVKQSTPLSAIDNKKDISYQVKEQKEQKPRKQRNRPVTPLLSGGKRTDNSDLMSSSPRSFREKDKNMLIQPQIPGSVKSKSTPKRSSSIKRIDKEAEEKQKRDQYKGKIAWTATSPKGTGAQMNFKDNDPTKQKNNLLQKSPLKNSNSNMLKRELLEKAKIALAENSKVNIGLDLKKIQETLNKLTTEQKPINGLSQGALSGIPQSSNQKSTGNIINNNNINNFFIQSAQVIEIPTATSTSLPIAANLGKQAGNNFNAAAIIGGLNSSQQSQAQIPSAQILEQQTVKKVQAPIGQFHHKRANSGSLQMAQLIKQNLQSNSQFNAATFGQQLPNTQSIHKKNQLSEHLVTQQQLNQFQLQQAPNLHQIVMNQSLNEPSVQSSSSNGAVRASLTRPQSSQNSNQNSKKDFKNMIRQIQKESVLQMQQTQNFWMNQAKKFQLKSQKVNYSASMAGQMPVNDPSSLAKKQAIQQITQQMKNEANMLTSQNRPQSAQGNQHNMHMKSQQLLNQAMNLANHNGSLSRGGGGIGLGSNKNRRLRKSNDFLPNQMQQLQLGQVDMTANIIKQQRRAQTPMPSSPSHQVIANSNLINQGISNLEKHNKTQKLVNNSGLIIQNLSLNNGLPLAQSMKPIFKKRSKSPSITSGPSQQKLQQKTVYMLLNNTFGNQTKQTNNSTTAFSKIQSQSFKRKNLNNLTQSAEVTSRDKQNGFISPKKNQWLNN